MGIFGLLPHKVHKRTRTFRPWNRQRVSLKAKWAGSSDLVLHLRCMKLHLRKPLDVHTEFLSASRRGITCTIVSTTLMIPMSTRRGEGRGGFRARTFPAPMAPLLGWRSMLPFGLLGFVSLWPSSRDRTCSMRHELKSLEWLHGSGNPRLVPEGCIPNFPRGLVDTIRCWPGELRAES